MPLPTYQSQLNDHDNFVVSTFHDRQSPSLKESYLSPNSLLNHSSTPIKLSLPPIFPATALFDLSAVPISVSTSPKYLPPIHCVKRNMSLTCSSTTSPYVGNSSVLISTYRDFLPVTFSNAAQSAVKLIGSAAPWTCTLLYVSGDRKTPCTMSP
jgi:hypothetical protein